MKKISFKNGIHIHGASKMKNMSIKNKKFKVLEPSVVSIPLGQHIGKPSLPLVTKGESVLCGQLIGQADGDFSGNIHSPVSGTVLGIEKKVSPNGMVGDTIIIENDKGNKWVPLKPRVKAEVDKLKRDDIINIIFEKGIVGLGGATFPTHIKYKGDLDCDYVILNGIECEPYNTADYITMKEHGDEIVRGLSYFLKAANAKSGIIAIEDNKMDVYTQFKNKAKYYSNIEVVLCAEKYPQGAEKQLISAVLKKEVPSGGLPINVKTIVNNVGTAKALCDAVEKDLPLTHHYLTLSGENTLYPQNFLVPVGITFDDVIAAAGHKGSDFNLIAGGAMMGKIMISLETPVTKGINAIILQKVKRKTENPCIKCARCVSHCPAFLSPTSLTTMQKHKLVEEMKENGILDCIECGCCSYVCPANIPLLDYIRAGKIDVRRS